MLKLTEQLQEELERIHSPVRLQTNQDTTWKLNLNEWAYADINDRQLQASTIVGQLGKHVQLEEKGITAATSTTNDVAEIATIVDKWLSKQVDVWQLSREHPSVTIADWYEKLMTLSNQDLLALRWSQFSGRVKKGQVLFREDVFEAFRRSFSELYPFFSHDQLWFSNVIELPNDTFMSPVIACSKDVIEVSMEINDWSANKSYKTTNIQAAIDKAKELLPRDYTPIVNPLKS